MMGVSTVWFVVVQAVAVLRRARGSSSEGRRDRSSPLVGGGSTTAGSNVGSSTSRPCASSSYSASLQGIGLRVVPSLQPGPISHRPPGLPRSEMMAEPYASLFFDQVRAGAGSVDIHDSANKDGFARHSAASDVFLAREVSRVSHHRRALSSLLEPFVQRSGRVADVGCSTGASAVALALSDVLSPEEVIGIDPSQPSLEAAAIRAKGCGVHGQVRFERNQPGQPLPLPTASFDLTTCISVLEFLSDDAARRDFIRELKRITRPGGHIYLSTPNPYRLRNVHDRRFLGDWRRKSGHPWASQAGFIQTLFADCEEVPIWDHLVKQRLSSCVRSNEHLPNIVVAAARAAAPWQKFLYRMPG